MVHFDLPHSVEAYYQEVGRGGRDGLPCHCTLLHSSGDRVRAAQLLQKTLRNPTRLANALSRLDQMADFAGGNPNGCRHAAILAYFGEISALKYRNPDFKPALPTAVAGSGAGAGAGAAGAGADVNDRDRGSAHPSWQDAEFVCPGCDICEAAAKQEAGVGRTGGGGEPEVAGQDEHRTVLIALSGVGWSMPAPRSGPAADLIASRSAELTGGFGQGKLALMLAGSRAKAVEQAEAAGVRLRNIPTRGLLQELKQAKCKELLTVLLEEGLLEEKLRRTTKSAYSVLELTAEGQAVLDGRRPLQAGTLPPELVLRGEIPAPASTFGTLATDKAAADKAE
eukprot:SAG22_NODE_773_length_7297_cov_102.041539_5_plen_338_part_00